MTQPYTGSAVRYPAVSVAEALRTRFVLDAESRRRSARRLVAEALWVRPPQLRPPADRHLVRGGSARPASGSRPGSRTRPGRPPLPQRGRRGIPVPARRAQPPSAELLGRVLAGLQRL